MTSFSNACVCSPAIFTTPAGGNVMFTATDSDLAMSEVISVIHLIQSESVIKPAEVAKSGFESCICGKSSSKGRGWSERRAIRMLVKCRLSKESG